MPGMDLLDGVVAVWKALQRGDEEAAYRVYFPVCAIVALQLQAGLDGFLAVEKYLMVEARAVPDRRAAASRTAGNSTPRPPPKWTGCSTDASCTR